MKSFALEAKKILVMLLAVLNAQAARSALGTLEYVLTRDLLISRMKNVKLQETLAFETLAPEVLKRAQRFEYIKQIFVKLLIWSTKVIFRNFPNHQKHRVA